MTDKEVLKKLWDMAEKMNLEEIKRFCEGTMNAIVVVEQVFKNRFPKEFEEWEDSEFFNGDILKELSDK